MKFNYPRLSSIMYITHRSVTFIGISPRQLTSYIPNCCNNFSEDSEIWIFPAMTNTQKRVNNNYSPLNTVYMYINYLIAPRKNGVWQTFPLFYSQCNVFHPLLMITHHIYLSIFVKNKFTLNMIAL